MSSALLDGALPVSHLGFDERHPSVSRPDNIGTLPHVWNLESHAIAVGLKEVDEQLDHLSFRTRASFRSLPSVTQHLRIPPTKMKPA